MTKRTGAAFSAQLRPLEEAPEYRMANLKFAIRHFRGTDT
jgi:hypothetical protein